VKRESSSRELPWKCDPIRAEAPEFLPPRGQDGGVEPPREEIEIGLGRDRRRDLGGLLREPQLQDS
jgi:hypothetical protein